MTKTKKLMIVLLIILIILLLFLIFRDQIAEKINELFVTIYAADPYVTDGCW